VDGDAAMLQCYHHDDLNLLVYTGGRIQMWFCKGWDTTPGSDVHNLFITIEVSGIKTIPLKFVVKPASPRDLVLIRPYGTECIAGASTRGRSLGASALSQHPTSGGRGHRAAARTPCLTVIFLPPSVSNLKFLYSRHLFLAAMFGSFVHC
jgi:hypothetical protein